MRIRSRNRGKPDTTFPKAPRSFGNRRNWSWKVLCGTQRARVSTSGSSTSCGPFSQEKERKIKNGASDCMAPARCLKWISLSLGMWTMSRLSTGNTAMIMRTRRTPVGSRTLRVRRLCFRNTDILLTYTIEVSFSWGRPNGRLSWEQNEISDEKKFVFDGTKFFSRLQLYIDSTFS